MTHGFMTEGDIKRSREHELKDHNFLDHELMISTVHIMTELATRDSHIKLLSWKQGKEDLIDYVTDPEGERGAICPDAFFLLEDTTRPAGENRRGFFLEADRSSMSRGLRMDDKYSRYREYI